VSSSGIRSACPYCGVGCGIVARSDGAIIGDPDHPANSGQLCSKGAALGESADLGERLLHPEIGGRRAIWDEALNLVAERFSRAIAEHGPDSVAFYVSGQLLTEDYYVANKLMKGCIGSANIDTNSRLCMASSVAGHVRAFGEDAVPGCYDDIDLADLIVFAGSNAAWCHPVLYRRAMAAKQSRGAKIVVIDPRRTATCEDADLHLPVRPGTDVMLFNGLLAYLADSGRIEKDYIERHTSGFDAASASARKDAPSLAAVAEKCRIAGADLLAFYEGFANTERTVTLYSQGINQSVSGTDKVNAILNCHFATGRIGKPGMGPFSLTGQPNAMGGREVGGLATQLAAHMGFAAADIDRVRRFWGSPRIAAKPGLKAVDLFQAVLHGKVKALWVLGTNPADSMPRGDIVRAALKSCSFLAVSDCWHTDTTAYAHVTMPAAGWSEKDGTVTNSERRISRQRRFREAPGEAKPDWWMLTEAARRMGFAESFDYTNPAAIFREHAALSGFENEGKRAFDIFAYADIGDAAYESLPPFQWPAARAPSRHDSARLFSDGRFSTSDEKGRFVAVATRSLPEATDFEFPLRLNTGRLRDQWHTMTRTGRVPRLMTHASEPLLEINSADAQRYGIREGGLAKVQSRHGAMVVRAVFAGGQRRGEAFLPMHWTDQFSSSGPIGRLTGNTPDPVSGQPDMKSTPIGVTPVTELWRGYLLLMNPSIPGMGDDVHWARVPIEGGFAYELSGLSPLTDRLLSPSKVRQFLDLADESELIVYSDPTRSVFRYAAVEAGKFGAGLFLAQSVELLPPRASLVALLGTPVTASTRWHLLAGAGAGTQSASRGQILCACHGVAVQDVRDAIHSGKAATVDEIGGVLRAGTGCGSCVPELRMLLGEGRARESARRAGGGR
jgi:assimilatory nitrate reductase catalytic subunit